MTRFRRKAIVLAALLGAGTLFQYIPTSCWTLGYNVAAVSFDFCSVLNCAGGTYFNLCSPVIVLVDCVAQ